MSQNSSWVLNRLTFPINTLLTFTLESCSEASEATIIKPGANTFIFISDSVTFTSPASLLSLPEGTVGPAVSEVDSLAYDTFV